MIKLQDVLRKVDTDSELCISRPDYDKEEGEEIIFEGSFWDIKYLDVRLFLDHKVLNIQVGRKCYGKLGVLYIDIARPTDEEFMI